LVLGDNGERARFGEEYIYNEKIGGSKQFGVCPRNVNGLHPNLQGSAPDFAGGLDD
jgi:hypothetical protein